MPGLVNIGISQLPVPALALCGTAVLGLVGSARCHRVCPVKGLRTGCHHLLLETKPLKSKGDGWLLCQAVLHDSDLMAGELQL